MKMKLTAKALPVAIALALAACGGGGDDNKVAKKPEPPKQNTPNQNTPGKEQQPSATKEPYPYGGGSKLAWYQNAKMLPVLGAEFQTAVNWKYSFDDVGEIIPGVRNDVAYNIDRMFTNADKKAAIIQLAQAMQKANEYGAKVTEKPVLFNAGPKVAYKPNPKYEAQIASLYSGAVPINEEIARGVYCVFQRFVPDSYNEYSVAFNEAKNTIGHVRTMMMNTSRIELDSPYSHFGRIIDSGGNAPIVPAPFGKERKNYCNDGDQAGSVPSYGGSAPVNVFFGESVYPFIDATYSQLVTAERTEGSKEKDYFLVKPMFRTASEQGNTGRRIITIDHSISKNIASEEYSQNKRVITSMLMEANSYNKWLMYYLDAVPELAVEYNVMAFSLAMVAHYYHWDLFTKLNEGKLDTSRYLPIVDRLMVQTASGKESDLPRVVSYGSGQVHLDQLFKMLKERGQTLGHTVGNIYSGKGRLRSSWPILIEPYRYYKENHRYKLDSDDYRSSIHQSSNRYGWGSLHNIEGVHVSGAPVPKGRGLTNTTKWMFVETGVQDLVERAEKDLTKKGWVKPNNLRLSLRPI